MIDELIRALDKGPQRKRRFDIQTDAVSGNLGETECAGTNFSPEHQQHSSGVKSGYFNDASLIRPQNIIDVHPNLVKDDVWKQ